MKNEDEIIKMNLKYGNIKKISFPIFLKESLSFFGNYFIERIPFLLSFGLFNWKKDNFSTEMTGVFYQYTIVACALMYDFQETLSIVLGPYYTKADAYHYKLNRNCLICLNFAAFLISCVAVAFLKPFYKFINLDAEKIDDFTFYSQMSFLGVFCFISIQNFLKGKFLIFLKFIFRSVRK